MSDQDYQIPENVSLVVIEGLNTGTKFEVGNKSNLIGRDQSCDLLLTDEHVSLKQCQLVYRGEHFTVIDLGSLNKTRVNGEEFIQKNLKHGDIISIGKTQLIFSWQQ